MVHGNQLIGLPIVSVDTASKIGEVQDIYFDQGLNRVVGIFTHADGLIIQRAQYVVEIDAVVAVGSGAILVKNETVEKQYDHEPELWVRRDVVMDRIVQTKGGTLVGQVGDVLIDTDGTVLGLALSDVALTGPLAENKVVMRSAIVDVGLIDSIIRIDLGQAEEQELSL